MAAESTISKSCSDLDRFWEESVTPSPRETQHGLFPGRGTLPSGVISRHISPSQEATVVQLGHASQFRRIRDCFDQVPVVVGVLQGTIEVSDPN